MRTLIKNCNLVSPGFELKNGGLLIQDEMIHSIITPEDATPAADIVIDAEGMTVIPGMIDIHCHGRNNYDLCDATEDAVNTIGLHKLSEGVTTMLPTTLTVSVERLEDTLATIAKYNKKGVKMPFVHLEGPFVNPSEIGAQNPTYIKLPDISIVKRLHEIFPIRKVSFAPELPGADSFVTELLNMGIFPSAAHSAAKYAEFKKCYSKGLRNLTHYCNQMSHLHHRDIGLVGAGLLHDNVYAELICDKIHISPDMIALAYKVKGPRHIILVTDTMRAAGISDGEYDLGGLRVVVADGAARLKESGALAGSTLQLNVALANIVEITKLPLSEAIISSSLSAACSLALPERIGRIQPGFIADIAIIDDKFKVHKTFVNGELRFEA